MNERKSKVRTFQFAKSRLTKVTINMTDTPAAKSAKHKFDKARVKFADREALSATRSLQDAHNGKDLHWIALL